MLIILGGYSVHPKLSQRGATYHLSLRFPNKSQLLAKRVCIECDRTGWKSCNAYVGTSTLLSV